MSYSRPVALFTPETPNEYWRVYGERVLLTQTIDRWYADIRLIEDKLVAEPSGLSS